MYFYQLLGVYPLPLPIIYCYAKPRLNSTHQSMCLFAYRVSKNNFLQLFNNIDIFLGHPVDYRLLSVAKYSAAISSMLTGDPFPSSPPHNWYHFSVCVCSQNGPFYSILLHYFRQFEYDSCQQSPHHHMKHKIKHQTLSDTAEKGELFNNSHSLY